MRRAVTRTGGVVAVVILGACSGGGGGGSSGGDGALELGADAGALAMDGGRGAASAGNGGGSGTAAPYGTGGVVIGLDPTGKGGSTGVSGTTGSGGVSAGAGGGATGGSDGSGSGTGSGSTGAGANGTSGSGHGTPVTGVLAVPESNACSKKSASASVGQLDMLIIQDKTQSMDSQTAAGPTKWTMVTDALTAFVQDPKSAAIGAGIEFFAGSTTVACTVATYETPAVGIAPLSQNATAIVDAIEATNLDMWTPTPVALEGGLNYAQKWAKDHPTHKVVVVLATDGLPNRYASSSGKGCSGSGDYDETALSKTLGAAKAGVTDSPSVPTYVIGVMAPSDAASLTNLNSIAKSGNTGAAFIVDTTANAAAAQFSNAMNVIRETNQVACEFAIPAPPSDQWIDFSQISVTYASSGGAESALPWVTSASSCGAAGGFYYDNNSAPTKVDLCPTSCSQIQADISASLKISFGCMKPVEDAGTPTGGAGGAGSSPGGGGAGGGGGSAGGGYGGESVAPACLLIGQSCQDSSQCCASLCNDSKYCGAIIH